MQYVGYLFGAATALIAIVMIAVPEWFFKQESEKKKIVGPSYWGNYIDGTIESEEYRCIESVVYQSKDPVLVGSTTYAIGRGVKE